MGEPPRRILIGRIVKPHGTRGEVVLEVLSEVEERFAPGARVEAGDPDGERTLLTIRKTRPDRGRLLAFFDEIGDRTAAERFHGALLSIDASEAAPLPEGSYYAWQLEGLAVFDEDGRRLGTLARVLDRAGSDLWVVDANGKDVMVPAVEEFVRSVDLEAGRIVLHLIPGLFE